MNWTAHPVPEGRYGGGGHASPTTSDRNGGAPITGEHQRMLAHKLIAEELARLDSAAMSNGHALLTDGQRDGQRGKLPWHDRLGGSRLVSGSAVGYPRRQ